jgi:hypothetical protein
LPILEGLLRAIIVFEDKRRSGSPEVLNNGLLVFDFLVVSLVFAHLYCNYLRKV